VVSGDGGLLNCRNPVAHRCKTFLAQASNQGKRLLPLIRKLPVAGGSIFALASPKPADGLGAAIDHRGN
jgi:hypothetical protein